MFGDSLDVRCRSFAIRCGLAVAKLWRTVERSAGPFEVIRVMVNVPVQR